MLGSIRGSDFSAKARKGNNGQGVPILDGLQVVRCRFYRTFGIISLHTVMRSQHLKDVSIDKVLYVMQHVVVILNWAS